MNKFTKKSILSGVSMIALLLTINPIIEAQENTDQSTEASTKKEQETPTKEVNTYKEFKNSKGSVSINPAKLSDKEMKDLGLNPQQIKQEFGISQGVQEEATKKWSKKISKGQLAGASATTGGVITVVGGLLTAGTVSTVSGGAFEIISGVITGSKYNGVKVGGTATKRLVRENPYQLPKKKWVYKITWAKAY